MRIPTGDELREVRHERGLTQAELARRADVSQPLIARIESGDVDPTLATLHAVVSALNDSDVGLEQEQIDLLLPSALKQARKRAGYTQGELAEATGLSQPLISRIERDDVNPRASTLRTLFEHLDPISEPRDEQPAQSPDPQPDVLTTIESEFEALHRDTHRSHADSEREGTAETLTHCRHCETDLRSYPDPNFCPNCGTALE